MLQRGRAILLLPAGPPLLARLRPWVYLYVGANLAFFVWRTIFRPYHFDVDWDLWRAVPQALSAGRLYGIEGLLFYIWSPVMAPIMAIVGLTGFWPWAIAHFAALAFLRSWTLIILALLSVAFWIDVGAGNTFTFVFVAGALALRGSRPAAIAYLALCLLMPRPIQLPLAIWLLWRMPEIRLWTAVMVALHTGAVIATGYAFDWLLSFNRVLSPAWNLQPFKVMGLWWWIIGIPLAVALFWRGRPGWAGLALAPYWVATYFLMPLVEVRDESIWRRADEPGLRPYLVPVFVSVAILAGGTLTVFADQVMPARYLIRPLVVASLAAIVIGVVTRHLPRDAAAVAAVVAVLIAVGSLVVALLVVAAGIVVTLLRRHGRTVDLTRPMVTVTTLFLVLAIVRTVPLLDLRARPEPGSTDQPGMYVVLLDGYPRADTLASLGIDIQPFVEQLEQRGFDHYPDARSRYGWTIPTLTTLLTGVLAEDRQATTQERRAQRPTWTLPTGFSAIAPAIGTVNIPGASTLNGSGMNDFEAHLIASSGLRLLPWSHALVINGLRDRLEGDLAILATTDRTHVFAHFLFPHPPFLFPPADDGPPCWPECQIFTTTYAGQGVDIDEWAAGMAGNVAYLNDKLLEVIDAILERDPDAAIVLFSDHGGRYSSDDELDEWHRTFLAARTPGRPGLFGDAPQPDTVLSLLLEGSD